MEQPLSATEVTQLIDLEINKLDLPNEPKRLYDPISYILSLGGKRIRPLLALMSYNLFADAFEQVLRPAISIELFHNFSLVHDDIMDNAPIRRGKETVHKKWNDNVAILSGDAMLVKAYEYLEGISATLLPSLLKSFNKTARQVCEGQQFDMDFEERSLIDNPVSEAEYMQMIRLKTAVLFGFSFELGGIIGGAKKEELNQLYDAGVHLGLAFQLQDDLLDLYGGDNFGKQTGGDILNAKKTYMLVKVMERASSDNYNLIVNSINDSKLPDEEKIATVKKIYDHYQISALVQSEIESHLKSFRSTITIINSSRAKAMLNFVTSLTYRAV
jgi:geranylgeranyl diphosphate synthase, type II